MSKISVSGKVSHEVLNGSAKMFIEAVHSEVIAVLERAGRGLENLEPGQTKTYKMKPLVVTISKAKNRHQKPAALNPP